MSGGYEDIEYFDKTSYYKIGVDPAIGNSYTYTDGPPFEFGKENPKTCQHEWWEDTLTVYTSNPPCYKQVCRLCGKTKYRYSEPYVPSPRWKMVNY